MAQSEEESAEVTVAAGPLRLVKLAGSRLAHDLVLSEGDTVLAVNGIPWSRLRSVRDAIAVLTEKGAVPVLITINRGGRAFDALTDNPLDGQWTVLTEEQIEGDATLITAPKEPDMRRLGRYAVYSDMEFAADIIEVRRSFLAMAVPPLWLISRRLWPALVTFLCITLTAFAIAPTFGLVIYLALCVYVGRRQIGILEFALTRDGKRKTMVIAATSELHAQNIALEFNDKLHFRFGPQSKADPETINVGLV